MEQAMIRNRYIKAMYERRRITKSDNILEKYIAAAKVRSDWGLIDAEEVIEYAEKLLHKGK